MAHGSDFWRAQRIAADANIAIVSKRTSTGDVRCFRVFRKTSPRLTFLGEAASEERLLRLVERCARTAVCAGGGA